MTSDPIPVVWALMQAMIDFPEIKLAQSYLIGDSDTDIIAGKKMGLITVKVDNEAL